MKKRGFTLVELLTTIVILAIILLITVPIIINVLEKAKKGAFLDSVISYAYAIKSKYSIEKIEDINETTDFVIIDGKVNGKYIVSNEKELFRGIVNFNSNGKYFLIITDGKYCAYKNYNDKEPQIVDDEYCNIDLNSGIYDPIIEVENENITSPSKHIIINYINDKNSNKYCILEDINSKVEDCNNWITVDNSMITFTVNKNVVIYAKVSNDEKEFVVSKVVSNIGELEIDKKPIINSLSLTTGQDYITATITSTPYKGNKIVKYYYSIDNSDYIESKNQYYTFDNLEQNIEYEIKVYVEDNEGNISKEKANTIKIESESKEKKPEISLTTTSRENDITITVTPIVYNGAKVDKYYYSIDNGEYIESIQNYYTFDSLEPSIDHIIKVYVIDTNNLSSDVKEISVKTAKRQKAPTIDNLTTTSGENDITITVGASAYDEATISKYYYSIDEGEYIESTQNYYNFSNLTSNQDHRFRVYVKDSMDKISNISATTAVTNSAVPYLTIIVNNQEFEYNGEMWYPYGTSITLNYSSDMTDKTGYYQSLNESTKVESSWTSNGTSKKRNITLYESYTYRIKIINKDGTESQIVEKKINIMPNPTGTIPSNYYTYNMNGIYPIYISSGESISGTIYGTDYYRKGYSISKSAAHMGLIEYSELKITESKMLYIKLIPCPQEGYKNSTRNGITSNSYGYSTSSSYYGFVFVNQDKTEIIGPSINALTASTTKDDITVTVTAEAHNEATVKKYYYSIDGDKYIESTNNYITFDNPRPDITHTINVYVIDSNGIISSIESTLTEAILMPPTMTLDKQGFEYNGEIWYPYGTKLTITYSDNMKNKYYQKEIKGSGSPGKWTALSSTSYTTTLSESYIYRAKQINKNDEESEVIQKTINIMPSVGYLSGGIPNDYYTYNMGGIYPVYIETDTSILKSSTYALWGTDYYRKANGYIARAAAHMGLIKYSGSKTTESKMLYIKLIPCPQEGYIGSTRNGITTDKTTCGTGNSGYGYIFVTENGTQIFGSE